MSLGNGGRKVKVKGMVSTPAAAVYHACMKTRAGAYRYTGALFMPGSGHGP